MVFYQITEKHLAYEEKEVDHPANHQVKKCHQEHQTYEMGGLNLNTFLEEIILSFQNMKEMKEFDLLMQDWDGY